MFHLRKCDLVKLNTMTKYPSIPTYHEIDIKNRGVLKENYVPLPDNIIITEKIDGSNAKIILTPDDQYIIGSREELLTAKGDLVYNNNQGIVAALRDLANTMSQSKDEVTVFYLEVFGGNINAHKQYTSHGEFSYRLFDIVTIQNYNELLNLPIDKIAAWRDNGGQRFHDENQLQELWDGNLTPRIEATKPPTDIEGVRQWLENIIPKSHCTLDNDAMARAEGVVVRSKDRSVIVKIRFEDYNRNLRMQNKLK